MEVMEVICSKLFNFYIDYFLGKKKSSQERDVTNGEIDKELSSTNSSLNSDIGSVNSFNEARSVYNDDENYIDIHESCDDAEDDNENMFEKESLKTEQKKRRSSAWQHFDIVECTHKATKEIQTFVKCKVVCKDSLVCGQKLKYHNSTKFLFNHLKKHNIFNELVSKKTKDAPLNVDQINYVLMMFIITASLPFRCVNNDYFIKFCKALNPNFNVPDRKKLSSMAKFYYDKSKNLLKKRFEDVQHIALTTDCWTSRQNYSYVGITAHYLKPNFKIVSFNLAIRHLIGGHAADNLAKYIRSIISEFKISSKVSFVVTDNAPNIINAVQELGYKSQRCFA